VTLESSAIGGITLSQAAAAKVRELITAQGDPSLVLRLSARSGGCSGFTYNMFFDSKVEDDDIVTEANGVRAVVDPESALMVSGVTIDYRDTGLQGPGFAIDNPNESSSCGCGNPVS